MGLAISAVTKCRYCTLFHTEVAKLNGATDAEIEDAVHYAKSSVGWSTYLNGLQVDYDRFKEEVIRACDYVRSKMGAEKELRCRDVGADCDYVIRGKTEGEIFDKASEHAKAVHSEVSGGKNPLDTCQLLRFRGVNLQNPGVCVLAAQSFRKEHSRRHPIA